MVEAAESNSQIRQIITDQIKPRALGFLGEPLVNVLLTNLALDEASAEDPR